MARVAKNYDNFSVEQKMLENRANFKGVTLTFAQLNYLITKYPIIQTTFENKTNTKILSTNVTINRQTPQAEVGTPTSA